MTGANVSQAGPAGPFARQGSMEFDGHGGFSGAMIGSFSGQVFTPPVTPGAQPNTRPVFSKQAFSGQYTVDSTCSLVIKFNLGNQANTWTGALTDEGAVILETAPAGAVIAGTLKQQGDNPAANDDDDDDQGESHGNHGKKKKD
jgi:hypothetical protein